MSGQDHTDIPPMERCQHPEEARETDAETGRFFCRACGAEVVERSLQMGGRLVPPTELLHRVTIRRRELEQVALKISQELHSLDVTVAQVRDVKCAWPGCQVPPMLRSRWCPQHKQEREKENAKERQRRRRGRKEAGQGVAIVQKLIADRCVIQKAVSRQRLRPGS